MRRNLDRRIEAVAPIEDLNLQSQLYSLLKTYIDDNTYSWIMNKNGIYEKREKDSTSYSSQLDLIKNWQNY